MTNYTESQASINEWQRANFPNATEFGIIDHLSEEFEEFLDAESGSAAELEEAADIVIVLYAWAQVHSYDLHAAIDAKMKKNREREWNILSDGTGRHKR